MKPESPQPKKLSCEYCHVIFQGDDRMIMINGLPYHTHHQPQKHNGKLGSLKLEVGKSVH